MATKIGDTSLDGGAKWQQILENLRAEAFPSPWRDLNGKTSFARAIKKAIEMENDMRFEKGSPIPYFACDSHHRIAASTVKGQQAPDYRNSNEIEINENPCNIDYVIELILSYVFSNANNISHPLYTSNIIPPPSSASLIGSILSAKLNLNAVSEHFSYNVAKIELEVASMISHLLPHERSNTNNGWNNPWTPASISNIVDDNNNNNNNNSLKGTLPVSSVERSGGITTFGGTGCYLYGVKYALTKVANSVNPDDSTRASGIDKGKFVIVVSNQGHYCSSNVTDWLGIGYDQIVRVRTKIDNNMDLEDLKSKLNHCKRNGKVVVAVVPTFGTTDAGALEDVEAVRDIVRNFDNPIDRATRKRYAKPIVYVDSVIGWIWTFFIKYDFDRNPLGFDSPVVMAKIRANAKLAEGLARSDAFGTDFHKTGYSPYQTSMIMIRDYGEFVRLMKRHSSAYLPSGQYDPGLYTLETSRSTAGYVNVWSTFKHLGLNGVRTLSYNLLDQTIKLRGKLNALGFVVVCNDTNDCFSTIFRIYPHDSYTRQQYERELTDESEYDRFCAVNELQRRVYDRMLQNLRRNDGSAESLSTPCISLTSGFRNTYYNPEGDRLDSNGRPMQRVFALKCCLNSPFAEEKYSDIIVQHLVKFRLQVINGNNTALSRSARIMNGGSNNTDDEYDDGTNNSSTVCTGIISDDNDDDDDAMQRHRKRHYNSYRQQSDWNTTTDWYIEQMAKQAQDASATETTVV